MAVAILVIELVPHVAHAQRKWELGGFAGYQTFADGNRLSVPDDLTTSSLELPKERAPFWGVRVSLSPVPLISFEIEAGQSPTSFSDTQVDVSALMYRVQVLGHIGADSPGLRPFVLFGLGGMRGSPNTDILNVERDGEQIQLTTNTETDAEYHFGGGLKYQLGVSMGLRVDLRVRRPTSAASEGKTELEGLLGVYVRI